MKKLVLNKETLVSLSPERILTVQGGMQKETWSDDCGASVQHRCITDAPCNTVNTCAPQCEPPVCTGGMSRPSGRGTEEP